MTITKYTFIIPLYNKERCMIERCLESIPKRDDVQIIVVDDCSPHYYDEYGKLKTDVISSLPLYGQSYVEYYFLPKNGGPGIARNYALNKAKGDWLFFLDADDYYNTSLLENLLEYSNGIESELILFAYKSINGIKSEIVTYGYECSHNELYHTLSNNDRELFVKVMFPCTRMIKRSLIERVGAKFDKLYLSEDRLFCVKTFLAAKKIEFYSEPVYNYVYESSSLSHREVGLDRLKGAVNVAIHVNRIYKQSSLLGQVYDDTSWLFSLKLYKLSVFWYWYYLVKLFLYVDFETVKKVRAFVCANRNVHISLYRQWRDILMKISSKEI